MKQLILLLTTLFILGCGKDECELQLNIPTDFNQNVYNQNISDIQAFLGSEGLQAESTESGLHYIIESPGGMEKPELCDELLVAYEGFLLNGTGFDSSTGISFPLTNVILGWQEGMQLFGKDGRGTLIIPAYLGYGANSPSPLIPANSVLVFNIELMDF